MTKRRKSARIGPKSKQKTFRCDHCKEVFSSLHLLVTHASIPGREECLRTIPRCRYCERHFYTSWGLTQHLKKDKVCSVKANQEDIMNSIHHSQFDGATFAPVQSCSKKRKIDETSTFNDKLDTTIRVTQSNNVPTNLGNHCSQSPKEILPISVLDSPQLFYISPREVMEKIANDPDASESFTDKAQFLTELFSSSKMINPKNATPSKFRSFLIHMYNVIYEVMDSTDCNTLRGKEHVYSDFNEINEVDLYNYLWRYARVADGSESNEEEEEDDAVSFTLNDNDENIIDNNSNNDEDEENNNSLELENETGGETIIEEENVVNETMDKIRSKIFSHRKETEHSFTETDIAMLELHEILKKSGVPMYLFDKITKWSQKFSGAFGTEGRSIPSKKQFAKEMAKKIYSPSFAKSLEPITENCRLSPTNSAQVTRFCFMSKLISLLTNKDLMKDENLLLNPDDPFKSVLDEGCFLDDLNSGWWHRETFKEICLKDNEILLPLIFFIDGGKVTEHMSLEPIVFTLGIFKRLIRNCPDAWRTLGYIESEKNFTDASYTQDNRETSEKWEAYHKICEKILCDVQQLVGEDGGFKWTLDIGGKKHDVVFKLAVQVVIGDCEGLKKVCLHFGKTGSKVLCRDCMVSAEDSDDPNHKCEYTTMDHILGKTTKELTAICKHNVKNAFHPLYYGARRLSIYQCTPPEPLHSFLLGLLKYQFEQFLKVVPKEVMTLIETSVRKLYNSFSRQSTRDFPTLSSIQNSVQKPGTLSAKEQYSRCFAVYLTLLIPSVFDALANTRPRGEHNVLLESMGRERAKKWFELFEQSLCVYQWIMKDEHPPHTLRDPDNRTESIAQKTIRKYLAKYKELVGNRDGAGLKINKFHQTLHYVNQIKKDGSIQNIDSGRPESNAVSMYKDLAKNTQRRQRSIVKQIAQRHYEDLIFSEACRVILPKYSSDTPAEQELEEGLTGAKYKLEIEFEDGEFMEDEMTPTVNFHWIGLSYNPRFPPEICLALASRLYFHEGRGGCLTNSSCPTGRTEYIDENGFRYRAHPSYQNNREWFDFCFIKWDEYSEPYPARIVTFLDLTRCDIICQVGGEEVIDQGDNEEVYLDKGLWVVIQSAKEDTTNVSVEDDNFENLDYRTRNRIENSMRPKIGKRYKMENSLRILPVNKIDKPCYCIPESLDDNTWKIDRFVSVDDIKTWHTGFLKEQ